MITIRRYTVVVLFFILMAYAILAILPGFLVAGLIHAIDPKIDGKKFYFKVGFDKAIKKCEAKVEELKKAK